MAEILSERAIQIISERIKNSEIRRCLLARRTLELHQDTALSIILPTEEIERLKPYRGSYELIQGKACLDAGTQSFGSRLEVDCFVAYGHWGNLGPFNGNSVDIITHLDQFLP